METTLAGLPLFAPASGAPARTTGIEWTDHTWNPFGGCSRVSEGCRHCYAERMAARLEAMGQPTYAGTTRRGRWTGRINRATPAQFAKPRRLPAGPGFVFVNSMSDFWHPNASDRDRADALDLMAERPDLVFQILTKRPELVAPTLARMGIARVPDHVWLGATVEDHRVIDRLPHVRAFPARVTFLSIEPMTDRFGPASLDGIGWAITGGESGPGRRTCRADWVREVRDLAARARVPFFHKQWGAYPDNPLCAEQGLSVADARRADPHGKGGALLDGVLHRDRP